MEQKLSQKQKLIFTWFAAVWGLLMIIIIGGATYAWFSFDPYTKVEPISSTVSSGDVALLIANNPQGEFGTECTLQASVSANMQPISTADLNRFFAANTQDKEGTSIDFLEVTDKVDDYTIHGILYLKSLSNGCNVYFNRSGLDFGQDTQILSALRLGMKITTAVGEVNHIFTLDDMGNTQGAAAWQTTTQKGVVVNAPGKDTLVSDPAKRLADYFVVEATADGLPQRGNSALCEIGEEETVKVEYWLYLEGCDENCINEVQDKEVSLQLSFAGVSSQEQ